MRSGRMSRRTYMPIAAELFSQYNGIVTLTYKFIVGAESQVSATLSVFKNLGRRFPAKTFSRTIVNKIDNIIYSLLRNCTKIETFRKEET